VTGVSLSLSLSYSLTPAQAAEVIELHVGGEGHVLPGEVSLIQILHLQSG